MHFLVGVLFGGVAMYLILDVGRRVARRMSDSVISKLKECHQKDFSRWMEDRRIRDGLLSRAGYFLLNELDTCGRPLPNPKQERENIVSSIVKLGSMGPTGNIGPKV